MPSIMSSLMATVMFLSTLFLIVSFSPTTTFAKPLLFNFSPQHIKLALTDNIDEVYISWFSYDNPGATPLVEYSDGNIIKRAAGQYESLAEVTGDHAKWSGYQHSVLLRNLTLDTLYRFKCGYEGSYLFFYWSQVHKFRTRSLTLSSSTPYQLVWIGDAGVNASAIDTLNQIMKNEVLKSRLDMVVHVGDISYCDFDIYRQCYQKTWNKFMSMIEPLTSQIPYMTCPGNHDLFYNTQVIRSVFKMPYVGNRNLFYSFNYGHAHIVSINTEQDIQVGSPQHNWLIEDLANYNNVFRNTGYPWLIVFGHRPIYCSNGWAWCTDQDESFSKISILRAHLEELFHQYGVDIYISGHTHSYERTYPFYKNDISKDYVLTYGKTVHLVVGNAGNSEDMDYKWQEPQPTWSANRSSEFGYSSMKMNATHIGWRMIDDNGHILDHVQITRQR